MRKIFSLLIVVFTTHMAWAQKSLPDSVQDDLVNLPQDSNYLNKLNLLAVEYLKNHPSVARSIASHALEIGPGVKHPKGYARALTVMGNTYWYEGVYEFAQNYYLLAARQYQSINDSMGLGQTYNNIGEVYKKLKDYKKAQQYLLASYELNKKHSSAIAITLYNIGELHLHLNDLQSAQRYTDQSLAQAKKDNNIRVIAYNYWNLGELARRRRNFNSALEYYNMAQEIWVSLNEIRSLIQTYQNISGIYKETGKFTEAQEYLNKAVALSSQIKVADLQVTNYLRLSQLDSIRGNYRQSLYYLSRHNTLKDSVYNLLKAEQIARLQTIYETETRERENEQLRSDKALTASQLKIQRITITAFTVILALAGILALFLYRQRRKIALQKDAIEMQAVALLKLNEELQELNKNLESRISERTHQLTVQNHRLTEYTFINAHKLRAPVASMLGLINLFLQASPEDKVQILEHLKVCGEQLDSIVREISHTLEDAIVKEDE